MVMEQTVNPVSLKESQFTGGLLGLIGINILQAILIGITLGIGAPWAICMKERWIAKHTYIDGRQLVFDGTGAQLFGTYIKWVLLTIVTLGILRANYSTCKNLILWNTSKRNLLTILITTITGELRQD